MPYSSRWETLAQALERVVRTGISPDDAMEQIANAIADTEVRIRVLIASSSQNLAGEWLEGSNLNIPRRLSAGDFDWSRSCPRQAWQTGPSLTESYFATWTWEDRPIAAVDLRADDIDRIWFDNREKAPNQPDKVVPSTTADKREGAQLAAWKQSKPSGLNYADADAPLVEEMRELIATGRALGPWDAALQVSGKAKGQGNPESKTKRLVARFSKLAQS